MADITACTGFQDNEEDLEKFFEENPNFPHNDPLSLEMESQ